MVRISHITYPDRTPEALAAAQLETPKAGATWKGPAIEVNGWVIGRSSAAVAIEVVHRGRILRSLPVHLQWPGIPVQHSGYPGVDRPGWAGIVSTLGLPRELDIDLSAVLENGQRERVASIHGTRTYVQSSYEPLFSPLMLTSLGRSGSTWLMNLLCAHPQIVVWRRYPYECRTAKYWLQIVKLLSEPSQQSPTEENFHSDVWWVGPNPFFEWELVRGVTTMDALFVTQLAEFCQANIDKWYQVVAEEQSKQQPVYFAEKFPPDALPELTRELYPVVKEIFLVRDFRDMVSSILAFDRKRGFSGFGRRRDESAEQYIRRFQNATKWLYRQWDARRSSSYLIRYEELIIDPFNTLKGLFEYLGLDNTPTIIHEVLREALEESNSYRTHITSSTPRDSIGRWQRDLDEETRTIVQEVYGKVLEDFGYDDAMIRGEAMETQKDQS